MNKYPSDWNSQPLGKLYPKIVVGYVGHVNDYYCSAEEGIPFYRTLNIRDGYFRNSEHMHVTHAFNDKNKNSQIKNNDILIARVGANLGMVCKASGIKGLANMANAIIIKTNDVTDASADFYTSFLLSPMGKSQIYSGAAGGAQGVFNTKLTKKIIVPVPPLPEQRKIAKILSTWDKAIVTTEKLIDASKQQKKALMQQLLTGKKRFAGFEGEWEDNELHNLLDKIIDYRGQSVPKADKGIPLITARNVRMGFLDFSSQEFIEESAFETWMKRGIPQSGDILFTTEAPLGMACRYPTSGCYGVGQRTVTLRVNKKLNSDYLLYFLLSEKGQLLIDLRSSGSTAKGIKSSELKKVKITFPSDIEEQKKIASVLTNSDKEIDLLKQNLADLKQEKKALMQQLLTGKRRVKVA